MTPTRTPQHRAGPPPDATALRVLTCGSVDDGKSTLIGRLLLDAQAVLHDQLASVERSGQPDLALLTDGLQAEREQGITIDVAHRYFNSARRKFILADTPGHEQYTRNMVTAASSADAAVVLVDATKLAWRQALPPLLAQTRRHCLLLDLLRVPFIVFAINKLDAVDDPDQAFAHISEALLSFSRQAGLQVHATVPVSALLGRNVVHRHEGWCGYRGPGLLQLLEDLPCVQAEAQGPASMPVQWVEKFASSSQTAQGRRLFWGRLASGAWSVGQRLRVHPSGRSATITAVLDRCRRPATVGVGQSAGLILDRELDISRGDMFLADEEAAPAAQSELRARIAWLDDEPLVPGRPYWALHGQRWIKARVSRIHHRLHISTLEREPAEQLGANSIALVDLVLQEPIALRAYAQSRSLGALILVDTASHRTCAAVLVETP
jgi:sulfate adenylyltransferase subunit 1